MKRADNYFILMQVHKLIISVFWVAFCLFPSVAKSQEDSAKKSDQVTPAMEVISIQKGDNTIDLKANLKAKIKGTLTKLSGLKVEFYQTGAPEDKKLGEAISGSNGVAIINVKADRITADKEGKLNFKVSFAGNNIFESAEEAVSVKRAKLTLTPVKEDSAFSVQLKLVDLSTGKETTIPDAKLSVYVKRMFSALKLGEGATDENGEATIEIPNSLPGDEKGNITLIAGLEDNEVYGKIGEPLYLTNQKHFQELYGARILPFGCLLLLLF